MSSPEALAAVTATLKNLLRSVAGNNYDNVTVKPPSIARSDNASEQLNIFLYSVHYNPAFRNEAMPGRTKNGELSYPPMPLILKYLITAYGARDDDISGQQVMGNAMSILHDHPVLSRSELEDIKFGEPPASTGLHEQFERIRITPETLTLDDMSKLWSSFQSAEYRLSVGYEVSVVLIESKRDGKAPLPVLKRGAKDRGSDVLTAPLASLSGLRFPHQKPSAELGDTVTLLGEYLKSENTTVQLQHPLLKEPILLQPEPGQNKNEITIQIPDDPGTEADWPAGFYALSLLVEYPDPADPNKTDMLEWTSNQLYMPLAPQLIITDVHLAPAPIDTFRIVSLTVHCIPQIREEQEAVLLFSDRIIQPESTVTPTGVSTDPTISNPTTLEFTVEDVPTKPEPYTVVVRLRVDGVDSIPVDFSENPADPSDIPPRFDPKQQVTIT